MRGKVVSAAEAVRQIKSGDTVGVSGFIGMGHPAELTEALEKRFLETGEPKNLTLTFGASQNDGKSWWGLNRFAREGFVKKIIAGHFGLQPDLVRMIVENKIEAYNIPQGVMMHLFRAIAGRKPGVLTHVGLRTFADPRETGGRLNEISKREVVKLLEVDGEEYLFYKSFPVNVALIRGTSADTRGNISIEKEGIALEFLPLAMAARNSGGIVIAQVERIVEAGTLHPMMVKVPGIMVDYIVQAAPENHMQSMAEQYNPALSGEVKVPLSGWKPIPLDDRKIICRRAAMELFPDAVINLGIGMPEGVSAVAAEEGFIEKLTMTVEPGPIGGVPMSGLRFGCALNPEALIDHAYQFDFYDGGGLDLAVLGLAECDQFGNVNVSKFGPRIAGSGGFVNITQNTMRVVFAGTLTAGGLETAIGDGELRIVREGKNKKFVPKVGHITFSGHYAQKVGQKVLYVTERAVFELTPTGLMLTEIAPGVDLERDVLAQMEFKPHISPNLKLMDERIFRDAPMNLKAETAAGGGD
ncbi:acyl CoA:acetate/3-ketoacid CoA transferase [Anaeroselena agilis]|uniref:Acyl CoA:acetate/3-ketoacid CoA transferase n=1 Tax=Anaeroselena agilis TaxID=3063788 RepID=A0ABU3NYX8_9FIRM|nr:acyl CoA:acetate/3-ketoacid CoA transferase [Selenomonadales bacterium 4137-cl]